MVPIEAFPFAKPNAKSGEREKAQVSLHSVDEDFLSPKNGGGGWKRGKNEKQK